VFDYRLDDRAIEVRSPAKEKGFFFSSLCVQTGFGVHPASCLMGNGGPFPGVKLGRGVTLTALPLRLHVCVVGLLYLFSCVTNDFDCFLVFPMQEYDWPRR
jgi:hypothetical protein